MKMRTLLLIFLLLSGIVFSGEDISYFRKSFKDINNMVTAEKFLATEIEDNNIQNSVTIRAYKAVCKMMMAQYISNPFSKLSYFNEGKELLEKAIKINKNVENIHLRILVQINAPSFLSYSSEIASDKAFLLKNIDSAKIPNETKKDILKAFITSGKLNEFNKLAKKYKAI